MPGDSDLLFGKIAVVQGFCSKSQVDHCLDLQSRSDRPMPLGRQLIDEGVITEEQHSKVLQIQRKNLRAFDPVQKASRETILFGKLAVRESYLSETQMNECLRLQALDDESRTLGEIAVALGYLTPDHVKLLLAKQLKKIMSCPKCQLSYTVLSISRDPQFQCPRCKGPLDEGKPSDSIRTDAEFDTISARKLKSIIDQKPVDPENPLQTVKVTCKICGHPFNGAPDSTNRVRCPACQTTFVVKVGSRRS